MSQYLRYGGEVEPVIPNSAPLSYRLSNEVYSLDGTFYESMGAITTDPFIQALSNPVVKIAGGLAAAYHGYKRSNSPGVALVWGALGAFSPIITNGVALYQGYGKKQKKG